MVALAMVAACSSTPIPTAPIPTSACLAVPIGSGTIHGDAATPDRIVLITEGGESLTLVDQADEYRFVFDPTLRIVDLDGREVAREGDEVEMGGRRNDGPQVPGAIKWCNDVRRISSS
jgi:hypothetical protein